jgi:hypothetical protein
MSKNPVNLVLRFVLEIVALAALAYWGWTEHDGIGRIVFGIGLPVAAAAVWGTFRVPDDPRDPPVTVPGWVRLLLEVIYFAAAVILLAAAGESQFAVILGVIVVVHYAASYDRIWWLLTER